MRDTSFLNDSNKWGITFFFSIKQESWTSRVEGWISHIWVFGKEITSTLLQKKKCLRNLFNPLHIFKHQVYVQISGLLKSQSEMELKEKIGQKVKRYAPVLSNPILLLFQVWDTKPWSMLTRRRKQGNLQMEDNKACTPANQPSTSISCCFRNRTWKVTALIPLIWLKLTFDKILSNKLISMVQEIKNRGKEKKENKKQWGLRFWNCS